MKFLTLIRHAKSDWSSYDKTDFERSLNSRGRHDVPLLTHEVFATGKVLVPEIILSSSSARTRETIDLLQKNVNCKIEEICFLEELYLASPEVIECSIAGIDNRFVHCAICAHNPGLESYANRIANSAVGLMPTFGIVHIELDIDDWTDIFTAKGKLLSFDYPKKYYPPK